MKTKKHSKYLVTPEGLIVGDLKVTGVRSTLNEVNIAIVNGLSKEGFNDVMDFAIKEKDLIFIWSVK